MRHFTFLDPAKPSDSKKKYAKGIRTNRHRLEKSDTRFHRPAGRSRSEVCAQKS